MENINKLLDEFLDLIEKTEYLEGNEKLEVENKGLIVILAKHIKDSLGYENLTFKEFKEYLRIKHKININK